MTRDGLRLFFVAPEAVENGHVVLGAEESAHLSRALRMQAGATCRVATEGEGREYLVELTHISPRQSTGRILERLPARPPAPASIALGVPLLKGERFESVLRMGCELGVDAFHPLQLERCEARVREERGGARHARWRRIVLEAAKQCDRVPPPAMHPLGSLDDFLAATQDFDLKLMGYLGTDAVSTQNALACAAEAPLRVAVLTGPEGDLTAQESARAQSRGFAPVSLGPRILRSDTAPLALAAIVQHVLGDMG